MVGRNGWKLSTFAVYFLCIIWGVGSLPASPEDDSCAKCDSTQVCQQRISGGKRCVCAPGFRSNPLKRSGSCIPIVSCQTKTALFCNENAKPKISCPSGSYVQLGYINYGRTDTETCPNAANPNNEGNNCTSDESVRMLKKICDGLRGCSLQNAKKLFKRLYQTGPCKDVDKYLEIEYSCVTRTGQCELPCVPACGKNQQCVTKVGDSGELESQCECMEEGGAKCGNTCLNPTSLSCYASGDPHFRTFDQALIHFQGVCRYLLSGTKSTSGEHAFKVFVENERRNGKRKVSFVKKVIVQFNEEEIEFRKSGVVLLDGVQQSLPFSEEGYQVFREGDVVKLTTVFGLIVEYDGRHKAGVTVPPKYCQELEGLCGNLNGVKADDYFTKAGLDVSQQTNKYTKIGNSWKVPTDEVCVSDDEDIVPPEVTDPMCQPLEDMSEDNPLLACLLNADELAGEYLENCNFDLFELKDRPEGERKERACDLFDAFVEECENHVAGGQGIEDGWEVDEFIQCENISDPFMTTTMLPTTIIPDSDLCNPECPFPELCKSIEPGVNKCKCPRQMRRRNGNCVGCYPACGVDEKCVEKRNGKFSCECRRGMVRSGEQCKLPRCTPSCDDTKKCKDVSGGRGVFRCVCKKGLSINPLNRNGKCVVIPCAPQCDETKKCEEGKCVCKDGLVKNPNKRKGKCITPGCDPQCDSTRDCKDVGKGRNPFQCVCKKGLGVNPLDPEGECIEPGCHSPECDATQDCVEKKKGNFKCACKKGFVEDGTNPEGSCISKGCHPACDETSAKCNKVSRGTYECRCKNGFMETLAGTCEEDKCEEKCHKTQVCEEVNPGEYKCVCADGFIRNPKKINKKRYLKKQRKGKSKEKCIKQKTCEPKTAIVCDGDKPRQISCPQGSYVQVLYANYGRTRPNICPSNWPNDDRIDCKWKKTRRIMKRSCDGYNQCTLKVMSKFKDEVCPGTNKYLEVQYACVTEDDKCRDPCDEPACDSTEHCVAKPNPLGAYVSSCECMIPGGDKCGSDCLNPSSLTCFAAGDPHYRTYDGAILHFQGTCRYLLTGTKAGSSQPPFRVLVENENRKGNKRVSWTKAVIVEVNGVTIKLAKKKKVPTATLR